MRLFLLCGSLPVGARDRGASIADLMRLQTEKYVCCQAVHSRSIL